MIEESDILLEKGFTVITGETGAGKSILLGALGLLLGNRADTSVLFDKTKKCVVEGSFVSFDVKIKNLFHENDLDYESEILIRREVNADGKSRAFINDSPVNLSLLKELSDLLIDIHSQHETHLLNDSGFRFAVIDAFSELESLKGTYSKFFKEYKSTEKKLQELKEKSAQLKKDYDYFTFQYQELEEAAIKENEIEALEKESEALENAENIKLTLIQIENELANGEVNVLSTINNIKNNISSVGRYSKDLEAIAERIKSVHIELKDLHVELSNLEENTKHDPERLEFVNARIDTINRLLKKHQAKTETELIELKNKLYKEIAMIGDVESDEIKLAKRVNELKEKSMKAAIQLSNSRKNNLTKFEKDILSLLKELSMPNAQFRVELSTREQLNSEGIDNLKFLFSANKGGDLQELSKVASGGELSRLMLCIKSTMAKAASLPSILFDEIDTGVSGEVADRIASILVNMGKHMQVISITHLPQIAAKGSTHLYVYKDEQTEKTISRLKFLSNEERIMEIAKMLSTGKPTEASLINAKELLSQRNN